LLNPIASPMSVMRSSLIGSLLQVLKFNLDRRASRVRVFEVGRVFVRDATVVTTDATVQGIHQPMRVAGLAFGEAERQDWSRKGQRVDFYDLKGDVEALLAPRQAQFEPFEHPALHPGRSARVVLDGQAIGVVGELHPRWRQSWDLPQAPVLFELDLDAVQAQNVPSARPVPRFQSVERDIAVVVKESVTHAALMAAIHATDTGGILRHAELFDVYRAKPDAVGAGSLAADEKSLAVRLVLNGGDATLTEEQIESSVQGVLAQLGERVAARLRS
jgi:phenylalanyl-tRNA synthetase beta chain